MRKIFILIGISLISIFAFSQQIEVLELNKEYQREYVYRPFKSINNRFDKKEVNKIAVLKGSITKSIFVNDLFSSFWNKANQLGGNSYIVDSIHTSNNEIEVHISIYYLTDKQIEQNSKLFIPNKIYVFGDVKDFYGKKKTIKVNERKENLYPFEYLSINNWVDQKTIISIGGIFGSKFLIRGERDHEPIFLSLQGLKLGSSYGMDGSVGMTISTGSFYKIDFELGKFMIQIYKERELVTGSYDNENF
jgi:hypothetical protein